MCHSKLWHNPSTKKYYFNSNLHHLFNKNLLHVVKTKRHILECSVNGNGNKLTVKLSRSSLYICVHIQYKYSYTAFSACFYAGGNMNKVHKPMLKVHYASYKLVFFSDVGHALVFTSTRGMGRVFHHKKVISVSRQCRHCSKMALKGYFSSHLFLLVVGSGSCA